MAPAEESAPAPRAPIDEAIVLCVEGARVLVSLGGDEGEGQGPASGATLWARRARGVQPAEGDRALLLGAPGGPVVVAVVATGDDADTPRWIHGEDGACALEWEGGDLSLHIPHGELRLTSGSDVVVEAARAIRHTAGSRAVIASAAGGRAGRLELDGRGASLAGATLRARAREVALETRSATLVAHAVAATAEHIVTRVERYELTAGRILESARESLREASELAEVRAVRLKTRVRDAWSVLAGRTTIVSEEDTTIDGQRVLLG